MKKVTKALLKRAALADVLAIDTETTGLTKGDEAFAISFTFEVSKEIYMSGVVIKKEIQQYKTELKKMFENPNSRKVFHNARFDIYYLDKLGFKIPFDTVDDTMVIAHLLFPEGSKKLKEIGKVHIDKDAADLSEEVEEALKELEDKRYDMIDEELLRKYAIQDTVLTLKVYNFFIGLVQSVSDSRREQIKKLYKLELKTLKILYEIETTGLLLNKPLIKKLKADYVLKIEKYSKKIYSIAKKFKVDKIELNSDKQLLNLLEKTGFDMNLLTNTKTGKSLQKKNILELIGDDKTGLLESISEYGHYSAMVATYLNNFLKGEKVGSNRLRLYPKFSQTVAITGRFSSFDPNFQNLPRGVEIRQCIIAPEGKILVKFDYAQIEVQVLAHCSKDFKLCSVFLEGKDIYNVVEPILWKGNNPDVIGLAEGKRFLGKEAVIGKDIAGAKRFICKKVVLGIMYSMGAKTMAKVAGVDIEEAARFIGDFKNHFILVKKYGWTVTNFAKKYGYVLNIYGRKRNLDYNTAWKGLNTIIQGSTADIMRYKMCQIDLELRKKKLISKAHLILQVHDEFLFEIDKEGLDETIQFIRSVMSDQDIGVGQFAVPFKVDVGTGNDYGHLEDYTK